MQLALELTEPDIPLSDIAAAWQAVQVHRPSTAAIHAGLLRRHILPRFGNRDLRSISTSEVQAWVRDLRQHLAPSTIERAYRTLHAVFAHAEADGLIARNPCAGVRRPRIERPPITPPTPEEIRAIVAAADDRYRALVILAAGTGLRRGECLGLTSDRIDTHNAVITVDRQLVEMPGEAPALGPPKTPGSYRRVPLPEVVADALERHHARHPPHPDGFLFTNAGGGLLRPDHWTDRFRRIVDRSRVARRIRFHDLRHFYASALIRHGEPVTVVQARLGHSSGVRTLDTYGHLWPDDGIQTRAAVDDVLRSRHPG